jgi:hypothetical protein
MRIYGPYAEEESAMIGWVLASGIDAIDPPRRLSYFISRWNYVKSKVQWFNEDEINALHKYPEELNQDYVNVKFPRGTPRRHPDWVERGSLEQNIETIQWLLR